MESRSTADGVHRLAFDVDWPPGHVACYVIDGPEPILVDATTPDHDAAFEQHLADYGLAPADVEHLLVTHPHVDHIGQVPTVLEAADPTVYAPAGVRERFARDPDELVARVTRNATEAGIPEGQRDRAVEWARESFERDSDLLDPDAVDVWVHPGDAVQAGHLSLDAVHTPGHQADHLSYVTSTGDERILLSGDMVMEPFRPVLIHDGLDDGQNEAIDAFYDALERLAALEVDRIYPGHGPVHEDLHRIVERDRQRLQERLDAAADLVADGHETTVRVALALAGDHDVKYLLPEAMAALAHLEATGRLTSTLDDGVRRYST